MLDLADTIQVFGAAGLAGGGFAGLMAKATTAREIADNLARACTIGAFLGTVLGMCVWAAVRLNGGVG